MGLLFGMWYTGTATEDFYVAVNILRLFFGDFFGIIIVFLVILISHKGFCWIVRV